MKTLFPRLFRLFPALVLLLSACVIANDHYEPLPQAKKPIVFSEFLGMNTPLLFYAPDVYQRQLGMLKLLGLKWVRVDLHWDHMEPKSGQWRYDLSDPLMSALKQGGFKPVVYLVGTAPFAATQPEGTAFRDQYPPRDNNEYAARIIALAKRYPFVTHWQVWNEPNILPFWRPQEDPEAYAKMLQASRSAINLAKLGDRKLVTAGMAYYSQMPLRGNALMLDELAKLGALPLANVVAYHPYSDQPEGDPDITDPDNFIKRAQLINGKLRAANVKDIWATEWGWSTYTGEKDFQTQISEQTQAEYLLQRLMLMMPMDYDRIFWFSFPEIDKIVSERDRHYGLIRPNASPKPAWHALKRFLTITGDRLEPLPPLQLGTNPPAFYHHNWKRADGSRITLFYGKKESSFSIASDRPLTLQWPASGSSQQLLPVAGVVTVPVKMTLGILEY